MLSLCPKHHEYHSTLSSMGGLVPDTGAGSPYVKLPNAFENNTPISSARELCKYTITERPLASGNKALRGVRANSFQRALDITYRTWKHSAAHYYYNYIVPSQCHLPEDSNSIRSFMTPLHDQIFHKDDSFVYKVQYLKSSDITTQFALLQALFRTIADGYKIPLFQCNAAFATPMSARGQRRELEQGRILECEPCGIIMVYARCLGSKRAFFRHKSKMEEHMNYYYLTDTSQQSSKQHKYHTFNGGYSCGNTIPQLKGKEATGGKIAVTIGLIPRTYSLSRSFSYTNHQSQL